MSRKTDIYHGRQGGHWLPDDYEETVIDNAPRCDICDGAMLVGQLRRHSVCDPMTIVGRRCACPPGCTTDVVGDGETCDSACEVCLIMAGQPYASVPGWKKSKAAQGDESDVANTDLTLFEVDE